MQREQPAKHSCVNLEFECQCYLKALFQPDNNISGGNTFGIKYEGETNKKAIEKTSENLSFHVVLHKVPGFNVGL